MSFQIMHRLPGRLRAQAPDLREDADRLQHIEREIGSLTGVRTVTGNHVTGSVLIEYDQEAQAEDALLARLEEASGVPVDWSGNETESDGDITGIPAFAQAIREPFQRLDTGVWRLTGGSMDLRFLVPVLFAGYGTLKLIRQGPIPSIPWYLFYWWSFRMYVMLNRQPEKQLQ